MGGQWDQRDRRNPVLDCIAVKERRAALEAFLTWGSPQTEEWLAAYLGANKQGTPSVDETEKETIHVELVHSHLPALESVGLIEWERDEQLIETTDHPALADPRFHGLVTIDSAGVTEVLRALSHDDRRIVLTILRNSDSQLVREELARKVRAHREDESGSKTESADRLLASLYHTHLPKLAEAEFIEYDHETGQIQYANHPVLEEVFAIMYEPDEHLAERIGGFFDELNSSLGRGKPGRRSEVRWPDFWRRPHDE